MRTYRMKRRSLFKTREGFRPKRSTFRSAEAYFRVLVVVKGATDDIYHCQSKNCGTVRFGVKANKHPVVPVVSFYITINSVKQTIQW